MMAQEGRNVLLVSSDPTPSLSDIFEITIGDRERKISEGYELYGLEISSEVVLKRWKERFGSEIYEVISAFAEIDYDFVDYIGTAPGIEEEYMLNYILELVEAGRYDVVIWDTAPAGHTLRLLKLPHLFLRHMEAATRFYMNLYSYLERLKDIKKIKRSKRTILEIIRSWEVLAERIVAFIRDRGKTEYIIVTIAEALGVRLTERMVKELRDNGMKVGHIIVNNLIKVADCPFHIARKRMQEGYLNIIKENYKDTHITYLYLLPEEVKGMGRIMEVSRALFSKEGGAI
jgi:arsenite-transporting ATPase